ncbi:MAG: LOG family protein [Victivallales bacterium]|nr:LOG family protein [Victivallales bacterium]
MGKKTVKVDFRETPGLRACEDEEFLHSGACRGIRLELEYLKTEMAFSSLEIESTFVLFGSARTLPPDVANERLAAAQKALEAKPEDAALKAAVKAAENLVAQSKYYQVARDFAALVTRECQSRDLDGTHRFVVVTGGGGGIMEAGNRGASDAGGMSGGLNITLPFEQYPNEYITPELSFLFHYFSIRKMHFLKRAKVLACFPGGFGTMDELFEALTLIQTKKMERIPVLLYGREFWDKLINWDVFIENGLISPGDLNLFTYCETAQDGWNAIMKFYNLSN